MVEAIAQQGDLLQTLALFFGVAWACGLNLYATVAILGLGSATGYVALPATLAIVADPIVIFAAAVMYCIEFMADKTPGVDTAWEALHTFIRIPAGALLAAAAVGEVQPAVTIAAGLLGGCITAVTHACKAGARVMINTSPEPYSNWGASLAEDIAVLAGLWAALTQPLLFVVGFAVFLVSLFWLLPRLSSSIHSVRSRLAQWLGLAKMSAPEVKA